MSSKSSPTSLEKVRFQTTRDRFRPVAVVIIALWAFFHYYYHRPQMSQTAIATPSKGGGFSPITIPIPSSSSLAPDEILVKVHASGVNPLDIAQAYAGVYLEKFPYVLGKAWAGEVLAIGDQVEKLTIGDRVLGAGYLEQAAAFQEYLITHAKCATKLPDHLSFAEAATIPHTFAGAFVNLFSHITGLALPLPPKTDEEKTQPILIWGGSSSTGTAAIQTLGALGFQSLFIVAGGSSIDTISKLPGVKGVYDRKLPVDQLAAKIRGDAEAYGGVHVVYSSMSDEAGWETVFKVIGGGEAKIGYIHMTHPPERLLAATGGKVAVTRSVVMDMLKDPVGDNLISEHLGSLVQSGAVTPAKSVKLITEGSLFEKVQTAIQLVKGGARESVVVEIVSA